MMTAINIMKRCKITAMECNIEFGPLTSKTQSNALGIETHFEYFIEMKGPI
jgi:hypothetical protein